MFLSEKGELMKWISKNNKKPILLFSMIIIVIAGLLDLKYEGLFFRILPESIQQNLSTFFNK
ncbi:hypothetical protein C3943_26725 [Lysinibacillus sp. B2A1]|nr:hypothetical protein C3943_26725 [Lysinibacillus sp. B2A1]